MDRGLFVDRQLIAVDDIETDIRKIVVSQSVSQYTIQSKE